MTVEEQSKDRIDQFIRNDGIVIGVLMNVASTGEPEVVFPGNPKETAIEALSTIEIGLKDIGREFALSFQNGDPSRPIILGKLIKPEISVGSSDKVSVELDGKPESLELKANEQVVLRCGKASITLTRAGKIILRGAYISSRSTGANRIKGGSVQLN